MGLFTNVSTAVQFRHKHRGTNDLGLGTIYYLESSRST
jgi:hypothetical protein